MSTRKKILVADDERTTREFLGIMLTNAGYEVVFAEDGLEAVDKATTERPDLVLVDGLMPKLHGFLACRAIKHLDSPPKVLMVSGIYTKPTYKWEVKTQYMADGLLTKPFDKLSLLAAVGLLLADVECDTTSEGLTSSQDIVFPAVDGVSEKGFALAPSNRADHPLHGVR